MKLRILVITVALFAGFQVAARDLAQIKNFRELERLNYNALPSDERDQLLILALSSGWQAQVAAARAALSKTAPFKGVNWNRLVQIYSNKGMRGVKTELGLISSATPVVPVKGGIVSSEEEGYEGVAELFEEGENLPAKVQEPQQVGVHPKPVEGKMTFEGLKENILKEVANFKKLKRSPDVNLLYGLIERLKSLEKQIENSSLSSSQKIELQNLIWGPLYEASILRVKISMQESIKAPKVQIAQMGDGADLQVVQERIAQLEKELENLEQAKNVKNIRDLEQKIKQIEDQQRIKEIQQEIAKIEQDRAKKVKKLVNGAERTLARIASDVKGYTTQKQCQDARQELNKLSQDLENNKYVTRKDRDQLKESIEKRFKEIFAKNKEIEDAMAAAEQKKQGEAAKKEAPVTTTELLNLESFDISDPKNPLKVKINNVEITKVDGAVTKIVYNGAENTTFYGDQPQDAQQKKHWIAAQVFANNNLNNDVTAIAALLRDARLTREEEDRKEQASFVGIYGYLTQLISVLQAKEAALKK